ncbi:putative cyclic beta-1, 2-glucan modification protein [Bifidobacterium pullorum]|uniref:Putative cyclic beta-1, 2-glucan modification protein n=1 Tax=Bifidobacterium pullorum TaxID=78448 RepID=A0A7V8HQW5_9BIFI|nr:putative cyclic beta-1, 2-glucan modification protein [Bifidobacterium pullorum]
MPHPTMVAVCVKEGAGTDPMVQDMSESTGMADIEELDIKRAQPRTKRQRKPFPGWLYAVLFLVFDFAAVAILQWGVTMSSTRVELSSPLVGLGDLIVKMFTKANFVLVLNMILVGVIYMVLLMLINRFWIATPVLLAVAIVIAVIEHFKIGIRYEAILPSDLGFLGSNTGNLMSFVPAGWQWVVLGAVAVFAAVVALCVWLNRIDARHGRIIRATNPGMAAVTRLLLILCPALFLGVYTMHVGTVGSWANVFSSALGDIPSMWDSVYDAQRNGPVVAFVRQLNPKVMDEPEGYSEETMREVAARYADAADAMNKTRSEYLDESTVIFVLNESFSDPSRVPGIELNQEATPEVDAIREQTTGGLMLSSGYGGGTANLEYMSLTGMSMANFNSSLTSPYQQLVPSQRWTTSVNQMWGDPENSLGFHPYEPSMYSRATNYRKFGFSHFYTLEGDDVIAHRDTIDKSPYVSDAATYRSVLDEVGSTDANQFISVITMQNHMPYNDWYSDNEFTVTNTDGAEPLGEDETREIETYAKGVSLSDKATAEFLGELDAIDKPITVVFYGDHLPGIYSTAGEDQNNSLALHLTDYFIWSNKASSSQGTKNENSEYTSPNYFIAQAAEHMNAKVSPFLAFLTQMHEHVSAMEPPVVNNIQGWDRIPEGQPIYLDADGNPMVESEMDAATRQLLEDYKLIQYDVTAGDGYLKDLGFMDAPER